MKYLKLFEETPDYVNYINDETDEDIFFPNVSLTQDDGVVHYNPNEYASLETNFI